MQAGQVVLRRAAAGLRTARILPPQATPAAAMPRSKAEIFQ